MAMFVKLIVDLLLKAVKLNHTSSSGVPPQPFAAIPELVALVSVCEGGDVHAIVEDIKLIAPEQSSFAGGGGGATCVMQILKEPLLERFVVPLE